jgi:branched-chain amino acid transport system permease protein
MDWNRLRTGLQKEGSLLLTAAIFLILPFILPYRALATEVLIFALATIAFDLLLGYTGIMIFCQASFFGSGAYISGLLIHHFQPNIFLCMAASVAGAGLLAFFFGYMSTRRTGAYCVLLTLAFNELVFFIAYQWKTLTGGSDGLRDIPRPFLEIPGLFKVDLFAETRFYFFAFFFFILSFILIRKITESPFGKVLQGIRENETRAQAIGFNTQLFKIAAFVIGGAFMGLAGSLYAMFMNFVDINLVAFDTSGKIVMMELIGGMGTLFGPILGSALVTLASDIANAYWERWLLILGVVFVGFVLFARGGVWGIIENLKERMKHRKMKSYHGEE